MFLETLKETLKEAFGKMLEKVFSTRPAGQMPVWAIDAGVSAFRALHCLPMDGSTDKLVADDFAYIEYPLISSDSNPNAETRAMITRVALEKFFLQHQVAGNTIAVSVSGQSGLARFIKFPPFAAKRIPEFMKYEARQQIPFDLVDTVWDYQKMFGREEGGWLLENVFGLFAMKRNTALAAVEPFNRAGLRPNILQMKPLALFNFILFDQMANLPSEEQYNDEEPPESVAALSIGAEDSDLVITDGFHVWNRTIPLAGNHFTKALAKQLNSKFDFAENAKRNLTTAVGSVELYQAMRPVYNDLLCELQRSLAFYAGLYRKAKIGRMLLLGNGFKLPGLKKFLQTGLSPDPAKTDNPEIIRLDSFFKFLAVGFCTNTAFTENLSSFATCYGLALQAIGRGNVHTSLLPK